MNISGENQWFSRISQNGIRIDLVTLDNKPLSEPMLDNFCDTLLDQSTSPGANKLKSEHVMLWQLPGQTGNVGTPINLIRYWFFIHQLHKFPNFLFF